MEVMGVFKKIGFGDVDEILQGYGAYNCYVYRLLRDCKVFKQ